MLRTEIEVLFRILIGTAEWVRYDLFVDAIFAPKVGVSRGAPVGGSHPIHRPRLIRRRRRYFVVHWFIVMFREITVKKKQVIHEK